MSAPVHRDRTTLLSLELQRLDCELRVEPMPLTSMLALDGVEVGRGFWEGRLGCGPHALEVAAEGFLTEKRRVILIRERPRVERVELERDPESSAWRKANPPRVFLDLAAYAAVAPTFSGDVSSSCRAGCERTLPVGGLVELMGGYQWSSGVGLSIGLGALALRANVAERAVVPHELPNDDPLAGIQSDRVTLTGLVIGAGAHVQRGESFPWMARVSGGVVLGSVDDRRSAEVDMGADGVHSYGPLSASFPARYAYVSTELRIGPRFRDFELALALRPMVLLALSQPTWDRRSERTNTRRPPGEPAVPLFRFDQETLSGSVLFLFAGGISARYSFL